MRSTNPTKSSQLPVRPRDDGFTLIEMLVLIIIIAVVSSIAVPRYSGIQAKASFGSSVQKVVGLLAWARTAATITGYDVTVTYVPQQDAFVTNVIVNQEIDLPTAVQDSGQADSQAFVDPRVVTLPPTYTVTDFQRISQDATGNISTAGGQAQSEIRFHDNGSASPAQFTIISPNEGFRATIEVSGTSGRASVISDL